MNISSSSPRSAVRVGLATLAWALALGPVAAETAPNYPVLLKDVLANAPVVEESRANLDAAQALSRQAGAWRNPSLAIDAENLNADRGSGAYSGRQTTYTISQPIELGGKRQARRAVASAEVAAAEVGGRQTQVEIAAELADAYVQAEAAKARLAVYTSDVERAREDVKAAQALADAGKEAPLRVTQAQAALSAANATFEAGRADLAGALTRVSALAGRSETYTDVAPALLSVYQDRMIIPDLRPDNAPEVAAARAQREIEENRVAYEKRRAMPDIDIGVGMRQLPGDASGVIVASLSLPLPLFDRNRGNIAASEARRRAADARLHATQMRVGAEQRSAVAQATASDTRLRAAIDAQAFAAESYRLARLGYEAGKTSLLELLNTRRALADADLNLINTRLNRAEAAIALARTNGQIAFGDL